VHVRLELSTGEQWVVARVVGRAGVVWDIERRLKLSDGRGVRDEG